MKKRGLMLVGIGGGEREGKINLFSLRFRYPHVMNIAKGRELMFEIVEELRNIIDADESGRKFLQTASADTFIFDVFIFGVSENNENPCYINFISLYQDNIKYKIMPEIISGQIAPRPILVHKETLQEARNILEPKTH